MSGDESPDLRRDRCPGPAPEPAALGEREREVLALVAEGLPNADIAARLYLSEGTVKGHVSRVMAVLGRENRTQLALRTVRGQLPGGHPDSTSARLSGHHRCR